MQIEADNQAPNLEALLKAIKPNTAAVLDRALSGQDIRVMRLLFYLRLKAKNIMPW